MSQKLKGKTHIFRENYLPVMYLVPAHIVFNLANLKIVESELKQ
jgi:hypothetical protein